MNDSLATESNHSSLIGLFWFEIIAACSLYGLGFLGNFFALIVFSTSAEFRRISTGLLFLLMAIFNFLHLCFLTIHFVRTSLYHQTFQYHWLHFLQSLTRSMSTYLSVGIAIDRFIRSEAPLRARLICRRRNILLSTSLLFIVLSIFWSIYFFSIHNQYSLARIGIPFRTVVFCLLPIILMTATNIRMIGNIHQAQNRIGDLAQNHEAYRSSAFVSSTVSGATNGRRTLAIDRMLLYLLLANVLTFTLTQLPLYICMILRNHIQVFDDQTQSFLSEIVLIWSSIYFGIAFYFYCLASPQFRRKFIRIIRRFMRCQLCRQLMA